MKVDVRNPLCDSVQLKIRGGKTCTILVKYERLPMICFHCGRLGHGTNECVDIEGDGSPVKNFGASLRASPWKVKVEDSDQGETIWDRGRMRTVERKLFVTKDVAMEKNEGISEAVEEMAAFLNQVSLEQPVAKVAVEDNGRDGSLALTGSNQVEDVGVVQLEEHSNERHAESMNKEDVPSDGNFMGGSMGTFEEGSLTEVLVSLDVNYLCDNELIRKWKLRSPKRLLSRDSVSSNVGNKPKRVLS